MSSQLGDSGLRVTLKIKAAPKLRQIYWCEFGDENVLPEMRKTRPVIIISYKNTLHGHSLVVPTSTDPQEGKSAEWAHKLSFSPKGGRDTWVVCNHLYTVSTARLSLFPEIPLVPATEFDTILSNIFKWLPTIGFVRNP